ncbi:CBS domain-containing protein [Sphaerisporangium album]|uniref:CBS domain-containing protein n=1 Tax=Sphaerisporangium album TaxID=509200 RepID=A0A367ETG8_9ACTN|nr:CBS domain-containing protein [Sphaerisporangium album]RCG20982.1 CBS domain-containing protein [Sphaerisporangium album]
MNIDTMTAADVMSRVVITARPEDSPLIAWELMRRGGVRHLPVVDSRLRVLGVLTREDVATHWSGGPAEQSTDQVRRLLTGRGCPHVSPWTSVARVAAAMLDFGVDVLPVIGPSESLEGLVTSTDVLRAVAGRLEPPPGHTGIAPGRGEGPASGIDQC